jgi:hypothetical protein
MSKNVVDCVIKHSQKYSVGLIPSRRQVDFFGGYVNSWNTKSFSEYVHSFNPDILICRDHGGPFQGQEEDDGLISFKSDSQYFNLVHIDPFKKSKSILDAAQQTASTIRQLFFFNPNLMYEVGTEEAIFKYQPNELDVFLNYLKQNLSLDEFLKIKYAVVQSGTRLDLSTRTNIGNFNVSRLKKFIQVTKNYGLMSKEHNGDYLTDSFDVEIRFDVGLDAINIAPEYGQIESEFYLELCKEDPTLFETLYQMCYNSGKWKKWISDINKVSKDQLIITCCHYILSEDNFIKNIKSNFKNSDNQIQKRINSQLKLLNEQTKNYCV